MKKSLSMFLAFVALYAVAPAARGSTILWSSPTPISTDGSGSDVLNTGGALVVAEYAGGNGAGSQTVNGVTFQEGLSDYAGYQGTFVGGLSGFTTNNSAYDTVLDGFDYDGNNPNTLTISGLTPGTTYDVQLWSLDDRDCCGGRTVNYDDGAGGAFDRICLEFQRFHDWNLCRRRHDAADRSRQWRWAVSNQSQRVFSAGGSRRGARAGFDRAVGSWRYRPDCGHRPQPGLIFRRRTASGILPILLPILHGSHFRGHRRSPVTARHPTRVALDAARLATLGFLLSLYLLWSSAAAGPVGCGASSGCQEVLNSRWSRWLGIPVSALALGVYGSMILASLVVNRTHADSQRRAAAATMIGGAFLAAGAAIWFVTLQWVVLRSVCAYCVAVHCCGLLAGSWAILHGRGLLPRKQRISAITVALFSVGMLIAGQLLAPPTTFRVNIADSGAQSADAQSATAPIASFRVPGGRFDMASGAVPTVGSPQATHYLVMLSDYACPYCRQMHRVLEKTLARYDGRIGLIVLPIPLDRKCNALLVQSEPPEPQDCAPESLGNRGLAHRSGGLCNNGSVVNGCRPRAA